MTKAKILYVEDDIYLSYVTKDNLEEKGYNVVYCKDGKEALNCFRKESFDLCLLDVMLPELDGFSLAKKIRERNSHIPILFLSAKSMKEDRITGLTIGGDDYITKPFSIEELILKIEVFLKRSRINGTEEKAGDILSIGIYSYNKLNYTLSCKDESIVLTTMESELLKFFYHNVNKALKREEILNAVWGNDNYYNSRSLDVFISRLRKYLRRDPSITINNIHSFGFILNIKTKQNKS
ncbi:MAG: response regulator transcription factor [Bacteroidales bacterium]|nr:response regulator transcription factor [Bacteroidales bacterium]